MRSQAPQSLCACAPSYERVRLRFPMVRTPKLLAIATSVPQAQCSFGLIPADRTGRVAGHYILTALDPFFLPPCA